jgi:predicted transcriptional regulator
MMYHAGGPMATIKKVTSIRLADEEKRFLKQIAKAQQHRSISRVLRQWIHREMKGTV